MIEVRTVQLDVARGEGLIEPGGLVRDGAGDRGPKREQQLVARPKELPRPAGIEDDLAAALGRRVGPTGPDLHVCAAMIGEEQRERSIWGRGETTVLRADTARDGADR